MIQKKDVRGLLAQVLTISGWKKKGSALSLRGRDALLMISFQKSQYDALWFVNVGIWLLALGTTDDFPKDVQCHLRFRLEALFPELLPWLRAPVGEIDGDELETLLRQHVEPLAKLTELAHLRERNERGELNNGLVLKEARDMLARA